MLFEGFWGFVSFSIVNLLVILLVARFLYPIWRRNDIQRQYDDLKRLYEESQKKILELESRVVFLLDQLRIANIQVDNLEKKIQTVVQERKMLNINRDSDNHVFIAAFGGNESGLELDLTSFRTVQSETGVEFQRILDCTPEKLKVFLDRAKMREREVYLNLSLHSSPSGLLLGGQIVDATWLSSIMLGVKVLVIMGCENDQVGDFLGVVPYVISMSERVSHGDAAVFVRVFWTEVAKGEPIEIAYRTALRRAPSSMSEYVVKHW